MKFLDEEFLEREKQKLLHQYNCNTIKEVLVKQDKILEKINQRKKEVHKKTVDSK